MLENYIPILILLYIYSKKMFINSLYMSLYCLYDDNNSVIKPKCSIEDFEC